ncbi:MAG TPA: hypothetical protein VGH27_16980 [Streptosporangiaceae bacterium]|jgi:hypothetical protein
MQFDCANYTVGTSVLGGYELGGNTPNISYSAAFGQNVQPLYQTTVAHG